MYPAALLLAISFPTAAAPCSPPDLSGRPWVVVDPQWSKVPYIYEFCANGQVLSWQASSNDYHLPCHYMGTWKIVRRTMIVEEWQMWGHGNHRLHYEWTWTYKRPEPWGYVWESMTGEATVKRHWP